MEYNAPLISSGMIAYVDDRAGIALDIPSRFVRFDRYDAPFAHFTGTGELEGAQLLLISQPGERRTLYGLFEIMQTLEIVPLEGPRQRSGNGFTLEGSNDQIVSYSEATLANGEIKGFTLIWPAGDEARRARVLAAMQASFPPPGRCSGCKCRSRHGTKRRSDLGSAGTHSAPQPLWLLPE